MHYGQNLRMGGILPPTFVMRAPQAPEELVQGAATPANTDAEKLSAIRVHVEKLHRWIHCMSYNSSYFGEPQGLVKREVRQLAFLVDGAPAPAPNVDDPAERAYWEMDARIKGYGEWKGRPQSERDAFKAVFRKYLNG